MDFKKKKRDDNYLYPYNPSLLVPPTTQNELKGVVADILMKGLMKPPFDSLSFFRYIKRQYRNIDFVTFVFKKLKLNDILRELLANKTITAEEMFINLKRAYYIRSVNIEKIKNYKLSLSDYEISSDIEKFNEKAKAITIALLKEQAPEDDPDDLRQKNDFLHKKRKEANDEENEDIDDYSKGENNDEEGIEDDGDAQNFFENYSYAVTAKVLWNRNYNDEKQNLLCQGNSDYKNVLDRIKNKYASLLRPFCEYGTRSECEKKKKGFCDNVHFEPIIEAHTDINLGDCSYLDTCRHMELCKFVHYRIENKDMIPSNRKELILSGNEQILDSQWANCDIRSFNYSILGKFDVIMADPPWDIHMELPYGTLSDEEMKNLQVKNLQDDGVIFLWVTGRATELARECLKLWGYERKEELVWIKTNQLQRLIRTGRTGHWLNHSKEHCLIGIKGNPKLNRNLDCDVLVSEVRETSRKPDEIYELIERLKPGGRKLELFARPHNRRRGWISLGNQLPGIYFVEQDMIERFNEIYPDSKLTREIMEKNREDSTVKKNS